MLQGRLKAIERKREIFVTRLIVAEAMVAHLGWLAVVENGLRIHGDDFTLQEGIGAVEECVRYVESLGFSVSWFKHTGRIDINWKMR